MKFKVTHVYAIGASCLFIASIFSAGFHHVDEHFQILEFAAYKLGLTTGDNLAWEYHNHMRPAIQPAIVVIIYRFFSLFGIDNMVFIAFFLRLLSGTLCFFSIWLLYRVFKNVITDITLQKWYLMLSFTLWFLIYNGVRFSSESWSGTFFILGFASYFLMLRKKILSYFSIGTLLGLSFLFRYQAAFLVLGFSLWLLLIKKESWLHLITIAVGFISIFLLGIGIDRWFYGKWTLTAWHYFEQNIIAGKAATFGTKPWWWYVTGVIENGVPPLSVFIVLSVLVTIVFKRKSAVVWAVFPFILIHSIIEHKELRFMFPIIGFLPIMIIQGIEVIQNNFISNFISNRVMKGFMKFFFTANGILLIVIILMPADTQVSLWQKLYNQSVQTEKLYFIEYNPYERVKLMVSFYKREKLALEKIASLDTIPLGSNSLVVLNKRRMTMHPRLGKLLYTSIPTWVLPFNFGNWQDRTKIWYVYEVK